VVIDSPPIVRTGAAGEEPCAHGLQRVNRVGAPSPENGAALVEFVDEVVQINEACVEIIKRIANGTLDPVEVRQALKEIIASSSRRPSVPVHDSSRFTDPAEQVANLRRWNGPFGLGWTDQQLVAMEGAVPQYSDEEPLIPLTLCWTLGTLAQSIDAKLQIIRDVYGTDRVSITRDFKTDAKHTSMVSGSPMFVPYRLWWQLIDLGANRFIAPNEVAGADAAGFEIFDVLCQHPEYVGEQDGNETPYLDLPGLSVRVRGMPGPDTPDAVGSADGSVAVRVRWEGGTYTDHAEPVRES
jgi:hypothetical protein